MTLELIETSRCETCRQAIRVQRCEVLRAVREGFPLTAQYQKGLLDGLINALRLLAPDWRENGCPDCGAGLPGDGSCCDGCGWVRED